MKFLSLILVVFLFFACKKPAEETCTDGIKNQDEVNTDCGGACSSCPIEYSETGFYGQNLLSGNDTIFTSAEHFSLKANIPQGSSLKLELEKISGSEWFYAPLTTVNWQVSDYSTSDGKQIFQSANSGVSDVDFYLPQASTFYIKYFENGNIETKRKVVVRN